MQTKLLQATCGLVLEGAGDKSLPPVANLRRGDDEGLTRILFGLVALHRNLRRGCGNLNADSLRRTGDGQLVLVCDTNEPSRCEKTARNDVAGCYFLNLGEKPRDVDDLLSLGVIAAEILVPPNKRPDRSDAHQDYRRALAGKLPKTTLRRADRVRNRIIKALLLSDKDSEQSSAEFVAKHVSLVRLTNDYKMKPASWFLSRHFAKSSLAAAVGIVAICLGTMGTLWMLWKKERTDKFTAQRDLEIRSAELADVKQRLWECQNPPPDDDKRRPPLEDPRYKLFAKDVNLTDDKEFQRILKLPELNAKEVDYADELLNSLVAAARVWWQIAESEASESEASKRIDGQTNDQVSKFLRVWYAQAVTNQSRTITIKDSGVPDDYKTYLYRVSFHDLPQGNYVYGNDSEDLLVQTGKTLGLKSGGKQSFTLKWKAGQEIPFWLEYWYGYVTWRNVVTKKSKGALALPLLANRKWSENGFFLEFEVKPLPGPPLESASFVLGPPPNIDKPDQTDVQIDLTKEMN